MLIRLVLNVRFLVGVGMTTSSFLALIFITGIVGILVASVGFLCSAIAGTDSEIKDAGLI